MGRNFFTIIIALAALAAAACHAEIPREIPPDLAWPTPPERARIRFVDIIIGSLDVRKAEPTRMKTIVFGEGAEAKLSIPYFAAARGGVLYVTDFGCIHVFDFKKEKYTRVGVDLLINPTGIAVASDGTIFVGDTALKKLFVIQPDFLNFVSAGDEAMFTSIGGVALDERSKRVYVVDTRNNDIKVFDTQGKFIESFGGRGRGSALFNFPYSAAVDKNGNLYIVDSGNFRIQILDPDHHMMRSFGEAGDSPGRFARPRGIALSNDGFIFVVDAAFGNFQIFDTDGNTYLSVGTSGSDPGQFLLPLGIAIDNEGFVYVVDQMNKRVQIFKYIKYEDEAPIQLHPLIYNTIAN